MKKEYDCVEMMRQIQAEHRREAEQIGEEEAAGQKLARVLADPLPGKVARARVATGRTRVFTVASGAFLRVQGPARRRIVVVSHGLLREQVLPNAGIDRAIERKKIR